MSSDGGAGSTLRQTSITEGDILHVDYAMVALVTVFMSSRMLFQIVRHKRLEMQDYFMYIAYAFYLSLCVLYIIITPILFRIQEVATGVLPMPPDFLETAGLTSRLIWSAQICFYACLWSVKFSLLSLYRKLLVGLQSIYIRIWQTIIVVCFLTFAGAITSSATSCKSMHAFFETSECYSPEEIRAQTISLFLAYALDVFTDFLVMALPIHLVWTLQMLRIQKIAICLLFATGLVCVSFATIRVLQIGINDKGQASTPEPKWLTLWSVLETSIAVIIGCCPAFATLIRTRRNTKRESSDGYVKQFSGFSDTKGGAGIKLKAIATLKSGSTTNRTTLCHASHSSQEHLATSPNGISVTTALRQTESVTTLQDNNIAKAI